MSNAVTDSSASSAPPPLRPAAPPSVGSPRRGIPPAVAAILILLAVIGGGWFVWRFWTGLSGSGTFGTVAIDEKPSEVQRSEWQGRVRIRQAQRAMAVVEAPDFVRERPGNQGGGYEAKGGKSRLIATRNKDKWRFQADSLDPNFITADQRTILSLRVRGAFEDAVARHMTLTADQRKQLNALPRGIFYTVDAATQTKLQTLFSDYESAADKAAKSQPIIQAVKDLEAAQAGPTQQAIAARVEQIKVIVTADQIKLFQDMGGAGR